MIALFLLAAALSLPQQEAQRSGSVPLQGDFRPLVCFAEGTDPAYIRAVQESSRSIESYTIFSRWPGDMGSPLTLTWSLIPDGVPIPGGFGEPQSPSELFAVLDAKYAAQGGRATWIHRIQKSFDRWQEVSGVTFQRITHEGNDWDDGAVWGLSGSVSRGDIRIGMHPIDGALETLAYAYYPYGGGDIVFDSNGPLESAANENRLLRNLTAHEIGHSLGIAHVCSSNQTLLMEPTITVSTDGPRHDDIRAVQRHYGDPFEDDDTSGLANDLGSLPIFTHLGDLPPPLTGNSQPNTSLLSLDTAFESDWFHFEVERSSILHVVAVPRGLSYQDNPQNPNLTCSEGNVTNSRSVGDIVLVLFEDQGALLQTSNLTGPGDQEVLHRKLDPGMYFLQVLNSSSDPESQLYELDILALPEAVMPGVSLGGLLSFPF